MLTPQQRVVIGPLLFSSEFDSGNMGCVERLSNTQAGGGGQLPSPGKEEYAITVAPDCVGTPFQNTNRSWFFFSVSFGDPAIWAAEEGAAAAEAAPTAPVTADVVMTPGDACNAQGATDALAQLAPDVGKPPREADMASEGSRREDDDDHSTSAEGGSEDGMDVGDCDIAEALEAADDNMDVTACGLEGGGLPEPAQQHAEGPPPAVSAAPSLLPEYGDSMVVRLAVCDMNNQNKLFKFGYRPWFRTLPHDPRWRRLPDSDDFGFHWGGEKSEDGTGFIIRWRHRLRRDGSTTYFAFCPPFGYDDCQSCCDELEGEFSGRRTASGDVVDPDGALQCLTDALQDDWIPRAGPSIYFHRQELGRSLEGRRIDILTVTSTAGMDISAAEEPPPGLPLKGESPSTFPGKPIVFFSARVHPGETPGQFAFIGALRHLLSDDPRACALRDRFVFKFVPMLNPDGVARGHYRTSSRGLNLNRFYDNPTLKEHEAIWTVKQLLQHWSRQRMLLLYIDYHAHASRFGNFFLANRFKGPGQAWNVGFARLCQLNSPHFDLQGSDFTDYNEAEKECKDGLDKRGSGRVAVFKDCRMCHSYTLECNYHKGKNPNSLFVCTTGLPSSMVSPGAKLKGDVLYDQACWAQIGECMCVSLLDLYGHNCFSRVPHSKYGSLSKVIGSQLQQPKNSGPPATAADVVPQLPPGQSPDAVQENETPCQRSSCGWKKSRGSQAGSCSGKAGSRAAVSQPPSLPSRVTGLSTMTVGVALQSAPPRPPKGKTSGEASAEGSSSGSMRRGSAATRVRSNSAAATMTFAAAPRQAPRTGIASSGISRRSTGGDGRPLDGGAAGGSKRGAAQRRASSGSGVESAGRRQRS